MEFVNANELKNEGYFYITNTKTQKAVIHNVM